jgi:hypothetical protein
MAASAMMLPHRRPASTGRFDGMGAGLRPPPRPHEAAASGLGQHAAFRIDALAAQPGLNHAVRKLDALIGLQDTKLFPLVAASLR